MCKSKPKPHKFAASSKNTYTKYDNGDFLNSPTTEEFEVSQRVMGHSGAVVCDPHVISCRITNCKDVWIIQSQTPNYE